MVKRWLMCGLLSAPLCVLGPPQANAYETAYQCVVKESKQLADDGTLETWDYYLDAEFFVDKATGRMNGKLKNHGLHGDPTVIDPGSDQQALKVISVHEHEWHSVDYLHVKSFAEGPEKPFVFSSGTEVYSGTCKPY